MPQQDTWSNMFVGTYTYIPVIKKDQCLVLKMTRFVVEICGSATVQNEHSSPILNKRYLTNANAMMVDDVLPAVHIHALQSFIFLLAFPIHTLDEWNLMNPAGTTLPLTDHHDSSLIKLKLILINSPAWSLMTHRPGYKPEFLK
ncbi:hypothetical protein LOAG_07001 [Loa loa]|uniref:Uncharacterized protein n=1 Tax=Loa loa TaxID=7209 RepID=A0A1S0TWQ9_LOALO|nr:hypothetical protein LOAG_07001 [Loa loa]EFO21486.1 hypothetical protein LOAG_07001 [Loa loa]